jgi:hypothetical protein
MIEHTRQVGEIAPAQFAQFSTLLHHVSMQHYTKIMDA